MAESSQPPPPGGRRRKRWKLTEAEKLLRDRIKAHAENRDTPEPDSEPPPPPEEAPVVRRRKPRVAAPAELSLRGCFRALKAITRLSIWAYLLIFAVGLLSINHFGQANLTTAALMYFPPWIWIAPGLALLAPGLLFDWKSAFGLLIAIALFFQFHLDFQWNPERSPGRPTPFESVRVLTWNRGQGKNVSLQPFKNDLNPDFILLQDAAGRAPAYRRDTNYSEFVDISQVGQFLIMSRWPVLSAEAITVPSSTDESGRQYSIGARFLTLVAGSQLVIYSVHLPSPRSALESYKRGSFLLGVAGFPGSPWEASRRQYQAFWDGQISLARTLMDRIEAEDGPVIVVGDFNTPAMGPIYEMYADNLQDAHRAVGWGFGFTFPGDTRNPLALFRPWLRLDQMFASSHWQVVNCIPQTAESQHLPVFGEFKLAKPSS